MMRHAARKVKEAHRGILEGRTEVSPYRKGQETGCDYCQYRHICGFDMKIPGYEYRDIGKMSKEEAVAAMLAEETAQAGKKYRTNEEAYREEGAGAKAEAAERKHQGRRGEA